MSRVIRGGGNAGGSGGIVSREVFDAESEASRIELDAKARAAEILSIAEKEARAMRERAEAEGEARARDAAAALMALAGKKRDEVLAGAEREIVELVLEAAKRVVETELAMHPSRIVDIVRGALDRTRRAHKVRVRANPADGAALRVDLLANDAEMIALSIVDDPKLARGDCIVESDVGLVDARIEAKFAAIRAALEGSRG